MVTKTVWIWDVPDPVMLKIFTVNTTLSHHTRFTRPDDWVRLIAAAYHSLVSKDEVLSRHINIIPPIKSSATDVVNLSCS